MGVFAVLAMSAALYMVLQKAEPHFVRPLEKQHYCLPSITISQREIAQELSVVTTPTLYANAAQDDSS